MDPWFDQSEAVIIENPTLRILFSILFIGSVILVALYFVVKKDKLSIKEHGRGLTRTELLKNFIYYLILAYIPLYLFFDFAILIFAIIFFSIMFKIIKGELSISEAITDIKRASIELVDIDAKKE